MRSLERRDFVGKMLGTGQDGGECPKHKAAGPSGVTAEMIKAASEQAVDWLTNICNRIVKEEAIPKS